MFYILSFTLAINGLAICDNGRWVVQNKLKKCFCDLCDPRDAQKQLEKAQRVSQSSRHMNFSVNPMLVTKNDHDHPQIVTKMFEHPLSNYWLRMALKIIFSNTERKTEIVRTWVISLITSIALETVIKVGLINLSFPEHAERTASTNQKDWFYFEIDIGHFGLESELSRCPILNDIGCIQSLFRLGISENFYYFME